MSTVKTNNLIGLSGVTGILYDNAVSGLTATSVQAAIDELKSDLDTIDLSATSVSYDNTTSGLTATNVKAALDELVPTGGVVAANKIANLDASKITSGNLAAARITDALNASGSAPIYACRAWVNFNGTGTVAIRESGNVSSITDNATGDYTVNFTTAMPDANYSFVSSSKTNAGTPPTVVVENHDNPTRTVNALRIYCLYNPSAWPTIDTPIVNVAIFR